MRMTFFFARTHAANVQRIDKQNGVDVSNLRSIPGDSSTSQNTESYCVHNSARDAHVNTHFNGVVSGLHGARSQHYTDFTVLALSSTNASARARAREIA